VFQSVNTLLAINTGKETCARLFWHRFFVTCSGQLPENEALKQDKNISLSGYKTPFTVIKAFDILFTNILTKIWGIKLWK
jgi:hypothetical protein